MPDPAAFAPVLAARLGTRHGPAAGSGPTRGRSTSGRLLEIRPWLRESPRTIRSPAGGCVLEPVGGGEPTPEEARWPTRRTAARPLRLAGLGWATVELDRAADELGMWLGRGARPGRAGRASTRCSARGARLRDAGGLPGDAVLLLEPSTEGRLAASLARDGEGPAALYLRPAAGLVPGLAARPRPRRDAQRPAHRAARRLRLVAGGPVTGPHLVIIDRHAAARRGTPAAGTIAP